MVVLGVFANFILVRKKSFDAVQKGKVYNLDIKAYNGVGNVALKISLNGEVSELLDFIVNKVLATIFLTIIVDSTNKLSTGSSIQPRFDLVCKKKVGVNPISTSENVVVNIAEEILWFINEGNLGFQNFG